MLSHLDEKNRPIMVDIGGKAPTRREAVARALVHLPAEVRAEISDGDIRGKKGPVFQTAIIAGIMACKKTSELIPLCHPVALEDCKIRITLERDNAVIECRVACHQKTGVEMEALTGASIAALTLYDMCKALSHDIVIGEIRLMEKTGGKSHFRAKAAEKESAQAHDMSPSRDPAD